jgi:hypothetical protein
MLNIEVDKMRTVTLPPLPADREIKTMRPQDRERYVESVILEVLNRNPRGVAVSDIAKLTPFFRTTIAKHLEKLVATRQATQVVRGNVTIYYRNGDVSHAVELRDKTNPDHFYVISKLSNEDGNFVYVQEKEVDEDRSIRVRGGILIRSECVLDLISRIRDLVIDVDK